MIALKNIGMDAGRRWFENYASISSSGSSLKMNSQVPFAFLKDQSILTFSQSVCASLRQNVIHEHRPYWTSLCANDIQRQSNQIVIPWCDSAEVDALQNHDT